MCVCARAHMCYDLLPVKVRGQLEEIVSRIPSTVFWWLNSDCQSWWQVPFPMVHTTSQLLYLLWHGLLLNLPISTSRVMELQVPLPLLLVFDVSSVDLNSWLSKCLVNALSTEPTPQLQVWSFTVILFLLWWKVQSRPQEKLDDIQTIRSALWFPWKC